MTMHPPPPPAPVTHPPSAHFSSSLPSWALPVLIALVGGGGAGYLGHDLSSAEQPAVLALAVETLRTDQDRMEARIMGAIADLRSGVEANRETATMGAMDRFTRTDHRAWVESDLAPQIVRLRERIDEHAQLEGHPSGMARISDLERRIEILERRR